MVHLDTSTWKFFEFEKIFKIQNGFYNKKPEASGKGDIPFIGASDKNHGITEYYTLDEIKNSTKTGDGKNSPIENKLFEPNAICVTNNGSVGYAYYMDRAFTCSHDVNPLYLLEGSFNYYTGMFIASVIMHDRYRWDYGRKWRPGRMKFSKIKLPVVFEGEIPVIDESKKFSSEGYIPDWKFMERYIKSLDYKIPETQNTSSKILLNFDDWEEFILSELFDTSMGNGIDANKITQDAPLYKYVTRNRNNNGVTDTIDEIEGEMPIQSGTMSLALGGSYLGSCFVQTENYYTGQNVGILKAKNEISLEAKLFIATIIRFESQKKFEAFGRELNSHFRKDFVLKLPVLRDGNGNCLIDTSYTYSKQGKVPDWQFMHDYIKSLPNGDLI
ncbi:restriction endonuclease subunit S [Lactococcus lactis]|uniref:restriction endonuclease subunit S n=1 Tax=Lactococcus lactis TaxID=1358 RepID=UPI0024162AD6|nr:restriction endonuclease subunit S [Lactococcus lactis]MDG4973382.1 restriction endonuclease subunit S [Lactococcus lactis]